MFEMYRYLNAVKDYNKLQKVLNGIVVTNDLGKYLNLDIMLDDDDVYTITVTDKNTAVVKSADGVCEFSFTSDEKPTLMMNRFTYKRLTTVVDLLIEEKYCGTKPAKATKPKAQPKKDSPKARSKSATKKTKK